MNDQQRRRPVRKIGSLVNQLLSRRGYAQAAAASELQSAVVLSVGEPLGSALSVGNLRQGVLQIFAPDSVSLQELNFRKRQILKRIQTEFPDANVSDLRFRIQT